MNFITVHLMGQELLVCSCGHIRNDYAYLVHYKENEVTTAYVRCIKCLREEVSEELDRVFGRKK